MFTMHQTKTAVTDHTRTVMKTRREHDSHCIKHIPGVERQYFAGYRKFLRGFIPSCRGRPRSDITGWKQALYR